MDWVINHRARGEVVELMDKGSLADLRRRYWQLGSSWSPLE
jgi:hypothetical protein